MASMDVEAPVETPPAEEKLGDILSSEESPSASTRTSKAADDQSMLTGSPRRTGVPARRPPGAVKPTPAAGTTSSTTKSTTARPSLGSSLSKPPARPTANSSTRRPAGSATATTVSSTSHRTRPSTSSVDDPSKAAPSPKTENKRPLLPTNAKRVSITPSTSARLTAQKAAAPSTDRRSTMGVSGASDKKPVSGRTGVASPTKQALKPTTSNTRPATTPASSRAGRAPPSSNRPALGGTAAEGVKKRLSTIPASPAIAPKATAVGSPDTAMLQAPKPARPGLTTRKSTMSVTIEQRLREMELVNQMLQAAMAEDGDESDEVKEEYGKKVDETLADLREKLEEARRAEGKLPLSTPSQKADSGDEAGTALPKEVGASLDFSELQRVSELESALAASQEQVFSLKSELEGMQTQMHDYSEAAQEGSKDVDAATSDIQKEHISKIKELSALHAEELESVRKELADAQANQKQTLEKSMQELENAKALAADLGSKEAAISLEGQKNAHREALEDLEKRYHAEKLKSQDASSRIENLKADLLITHHQLAEEKASSSYQIEQALAKLRTELQEKDELIRMKEKDILDVRHELEELQTTHSRELEETVANASEHVQSIEGEYEATKARVKELELAMNTSSSQHDELISAKHLEVSSLGKVIENLQEELQNLHESKDRELDANRVKLIQDHESAISKLEAEHRSALDSAARDARETEDLRSMYAALIENYEKATSELEDSKAELLKLADAIHAEKASSERATTELKESLETATAEISSLKKVLETFDQDSKDRDDQHTSTVMKIKDELNCTVQMLEEKNKESSSILSRHAAELEDLRTTHAKAIESIKSDSESKSQVDLEALQAKYDELSATSNRAGQDHAAALERVKSEHVRFLESLKESHAQELVEVKERLERKFAQLKTDIDTKHAEQTAATEKKYVRDINDIQKQHEQSYSAMQEGHEKALAELQAQVLQHREALADVENQLQAHRESDSRSQREVKDKHEKELDELRVQLAKTKSDAAQAQEEVESLRRQEKTMREAIDKDKQTIDELTTAVKETSAKTQDSTEVDKLKESLSKLTEKHASEIAKLQETMDLEATKREHERKQGAEVRDRLARELGELETYRKDLPAAKKEAEEQRKAAEVAKKEAQSAQDRAASALAKAKEHETRQKETCAELEKLRAETAKAKKSKGHSRQNSAHNQELEALQTIADKEREHNDRLKKQLADITAVAENHATRVREVEAALKVTSAELTEMQTKRAEFAASPAPKGALRTSRWASEMVDESEGEEERGAGIEGVMAGMQEQLRQLEDVNEDMIDDSQRMVNMLARATSRKTNLSA